MKKTDVYRIIKRMETHQAYSARQRERLRALAVELASFGVLNCKDEDLSRELWRELDDEHSVMVLDDPETKNWEGETSEWLQLNY